MAPNPLAHDVEPEPEAVGTSVPSPERLEQDGQGIGGGGLAVVVDAEHDIAPVALDANRDCSRAMRERVSDEVRDDLLNTLGIPAARHVAGDLAGDAALGV